MRIIALFGLLLCPTVTHAAEDVAAAECGALYRGHDLYERAHFSPEDVSDGWSVMSNDFVAAATRLGADQKTISDALARAPRWAEAINAHILGSDAKLSAAFEAQEQVCANLIQRLPEMTPHR
ncbi:hypothetical protein SAMN04487972_107103 [Paracoccus halophilus]|uniref:Uncharacterized protein n=2 Tax=Paracoccus halophilus TaxID=376733 RepID=A0A099F1M1_9RHOB|nr:hypothetical protein IT41_09460 [Paracoccus halophilus]SFA50150.1 hypothetical protein SAMN04487972_107103 [Paracoccus halophilus]